MSKNEDKKAKPRFLVETMHHSGDTEALVAYLTERAGEGWELVTVVGDTTFYFKAAT